MITHLGLGNASLHLQLGHTANGLSLKGQHLQPRDGFLAGTHRNWIEHGVCAGVYMMCRYVYYVCMYIYIYSDPKVDRIFFGGCGIYVGIMLDVGQRKKRQ